MTARCGSLDFATDERRRRGDEAIDELRGEALAERREVDILGDRRLHHRPERSVTAAGTPRAKEM
jgi:hypothetical protein